MIPALLEATVQSPTIELISDIPQTKESVINL